MSQIENAIIVSPLDEKMEQALAKVNATDLVIHTLKAKYGDLKLRSLDDKEMYLEIKTAAKEVAKVRNAVVKACKEGREEAVKVQKQWIAKEKEVITKIAEVESPLDAQIEAFDNEAKRKEQEEKQRQEAQYMSRTQAITKMGALYHDACFTLGEFTLEAALVKESSTEVWENEIQPRFMEEHLKLKAEQLEQERREAARREEMRKQQEELERQQAEFRRQQEAFERQKREAERKVQEERQHLQNERLNMLSPYHIPGITNAVVNSTLWEMSDNDFNKLLAERKMLYEEWQAQRTRQIEEAAAKRERARIEEEQRQAELKRQQEEARKMEELAKAGDKALWNHFIEQLQAIEIPHFKSGQYRKVANLSKEKIEEILSLKPY